MAIPKRSAKNIAWQAYKMRERLEVMKRPVFIDGLPYGTHACEGCGKQTDYLQVAHIFARRQIVGEPWASSRYLTMKLCFYNPFEDKIGCHEKIDGYKDKALRERLEERAASRLLAAFGIVIGSDLWNTLLGTMTPDGRVRWMESHVSRDTEIRDVLHLRPTDGVVREKKHGVQSS